MRKNLIGSALLALDAELVLYRNCEWTEMRESRLKQRNFDLILFFENACVKENRKLPLCKNKERRRLFSRPCSSPEIETWMRVPRFPRLDPVLGLSGRT
jgi:hypothetical protein